MTRTLTLVLHLAWRHLRARPGASVATLVVLLCASALVTASAVLAESGLRGAGEAARYARADAVVVASRSYTPGGGDLTATTRLPEPPRLPTSLVEEIKSLPQVAAAAGDDDVELMVGGVDDLGEGSPGKPDGKPDEGAGAAGLTGVTGHSWETSVLGPLTLADGEPPGRRGDVVVTRSVAERAGVALGDPLTVVHRSVASRYRVTGILDDAGSGSPGSQDGAVSLPQVLLHEEDARALAPRPGFVRVVGVVAAPGADAAVLEGALRQVVQAYQEQEGREVEVLTGDEVGRAEHPDIEEGRGLLLLVSTSFGGLAVLVCLLTAACTLALTLDARRREVAVLRAIGASPGQVLSQVSAEVVLLAVVSSVLGAVPGVALAEGMRRVLVSLGAAPGGLSLSPGPVPVLVATVLMVVAAWCGAVVVSLGPARTRPVEAMREAARRTRQPAGWRTTAGAVCALLGAVTALVPLGARSEAGAAATSSAVLLLVIGVALAAPRLVRTLVPPLASLLRCLGASGFLAAHSTRHQERRLAGVLVLMVLAVGLTLSMTYTQTTLAQAVTNQAGESVGADAVITGTGSGGIAPEVVEAVEDLPETGTATAVQDTQVLLPYSVLGDTDLVRVDARGVTPGEVTAALDPGVVSGDLSDLTGRTIALDRFTARVVGARVGDQAEVVLGDGAATRLRVVALYDRGLGVGGALVPSTVLEGHAGAPGRVLARASEDATAEELRAALASLRARYPTLSVTDPAGLAQVSRTEATMAAWVNLAGVLVIVAFIGVAVVNNLVMVTLDRARELTLLRLVGATTGQVLRMLGGEALVAFLLAVLLGTAVAALPLAVLSLALLGGPLPAGPPWVGAAAVAGVGVLTTLSVGLAGLRALKASSPRVVPAAGGRG